MIKINVPLFSPLCAAATAVAKSCLLFTFLSDPSGAEYRTVNALVSGNFFCSAVMRSLCAIMVGTTNVRTSAPATALTVTGGTPRALLRLAPGFSFLPGGEDLRGLLLARLVFRVGVR